MKRSNKVLVFIIMVLMAVLFLTCGPNGGEDKPDENKPDENKPDENKPDKVKKPEFDKADKSILFVGDKVKITCGTEGATIRYTMDPNVTLEKESDGLEYDKNSEGVSIETLGDITLQAKAFKDNGKSDTEKAVYSVRIVELKDVEKMEMVEIEGGEFKQEEVMLDGFTHSISSFEMGKFEVTYELWYIVYTWAKDNGYNFQNAGMEGSITGGGYFPNYNNIGKEPTSENKLHPVTMISWRDAIVWCNAYSESCGYTPVYKAGSKILKDSSNATNCDKATMDAQANGYRLPTEGQWQYAASNKGQTPKDYASGATANYNDSSACSEVAWYSSNSDDDTHPVGEKNANALEIHDMSGNVLEWCWDWKADYPQIEDTEKETDYEGASSGTERVNRGGHYTGGAKLLRITKRLSMEPKNATLTCGLRVTRLTKSN